MHGLDRRRANGPASAGQVLVAADRALAPMPPTDRAQWLPPSLPPRGAERLFAPGPFDTSEHVPVISRYGPVRAALVNRDGTWSRTVPLAVIAAEDRHSTLAATWGADGEEHEFLRDSLAGLNGGPTPQARAFTGELTGKLLAAVMAEPPPWNLARVIY